MEILNSSSIKLEDLSAKAETVLVVISTAWCGPCNTMAPVLEELSNEIENTSIVKVDVSENVPSFVRSMGIKAVPTLLLFKNGELKSNTTGGKTKEELQDLIVG